MQKKELFSRVEFVSNLWKPNILRNLRSKLQKHMGKYCHKNVIKIKGASDLEERKNYLQ